MDIRVLAVDPLKNMLLRLDFSNGKTGTFDVAQWTSEIAYLQPLVDDRLFKSVRAICHGHVVSWNENIDLPADFVYENCDFN